MIIALCAALSAAATPLLESPRALRDGEALRWAQAARQQLSTCQHDVAYLVALGRVLKALGQPEEAAEHIERALLLSPQEPDALATFAGLLADLGDPLGAQQIRSMLGTQTASHGLSSLPADKGLVHKLHWRQAWGLSTGAESNLLGVSGVSNLTLTLPGLDASQPVLLTLPLDVSNQPRAGGYLQAQASGQLTAVRGAPEPGRFEDLWMLQASSRLRQVPSLADAGFAAADLSASHQRRYTALPWGHHAQAASAYLQSRTGVSYAQHSLGGGADALWGGCHMRAGLEWSARHYPSNRILDGRQAVLYAQAGCPSTVQVSLRGGSDRADDPTRPGGTQDLREARARGTWGPWTWEAEWAQLSDRTAYSPLLSAGAVRGQIRRTWRLERTLFTSGAAAGGQCKRCSSQQWLIGVESHRRSSNLELFKTNNLGVFLSVISIK